MDGTSVFWLGGIYVAPLLFSFLSFSLSAHIKLFKIKYTNVIRSADGTAYSKYGFSLSSADGSGSVSASLVMDSTYSGGSTPVQVVSNPLPGAAPSSIATGLQFQMSLYLDHSMTEVTSFFCGFPILLLTLVNYFVVFFSTLLSFSAFFSFSLSFFFSFFFNF